MPGRMTRRTTTKTEEEDYFRHESHFAPTAGMIMAPAKKPQCSRRDKQERCAALFGGTANHTALWSTQRRTQRHAQVSQLSPLTLRDRMKAKPFWEDGILEGRQKTVEHKQFLKLWKEFRLPMSWSNGLVQVFAYEVERR